MCGVCMCVCVSASVCLYTSPFMPHVVVVGTSSCALFDLMNT